MTFRLLCNPQFLIDLMAALLHHKGDNDFILIFMIQEANFSNRGRYAVLTLIEIATAARPISLLSISRNINVSKSYLEQLAAPLRHHGLIKAFKGPGGGYVLAKSPSDITIAAIVGAVDEWAPGLKREIKTPVTPPDPSQVLWNNIHDAMRAYMRTITLHDVLNRHLP